MPTLCSYPPLDGKGPHIVQKIGHDRREHDRNDVSHHVVDDAGSDFCEIVDSRHEDG